MGGLKVTAREHWLTMYPFIEDHLKWCGSKGFSPDTTIAYRRTWLERLIRAHGDLHTMTGRQIAAFLAGPDWAPQTRATAYSHLNGYFRWAVRIKLISNNPMDELDRPRVPYRQPKGIDEQAFALILRDAVEPYLTAALLAGFAGLRCFEICGLDRTDVDEQNIRIRGKGGRLDEIPTHERIWAHLRGRRPGLLVRNTRGGRYLPNTMSVIFGQYCRQRLGADVHLHQLRRAYADELRRTRDENGDALDIEVIRTLMRHRSLLTTQRYFAPRETERRAAIQALRSHANGQREMGIRTLPVLNPNLLQEERV